MICGVRNLQAKENGMATKKSSKPGRIEKKLAALGYELPRPPTPAATYIGSVRAGNLLFVGGNIGRLNGEPPKYTGKVGAAVTIEQAYEMARCCALNHLAIMKAALGSLDRVK